MKSSSEVILKNLSSLPTWNIAEKPPPSWPWWLLWECPCNKVDSHSFTHIWGQGLLIFYGTKEDSFSAITFVVHKISLYFFGNKKLIIRTIGGESCARWRRRYRRWRVQLRGWRSAATRGSTLPCRSSHIRASSEWSMVRAQQLVDARRFHVPRGFLWDFTTNINPFAW